MFPSSKFNYHDCKSLKSEVPRTHLDHLRVPDYRRMHCKNITLILPTKVLMKISVTAVYFHMYHVLIFLCMCKKGLAFLKQNLDDERDTHVDLEPKKVGRKKKDFVSRAYRVTKNLDCQYLTKFSRNIILSYYQVMKAY